MSKASVSSFFIFWLLLLGASYFLRGQDNSPINVTISSKGSSLKTILEEIEENTPVRFYYQGDWLDTMARELEVREMPLAQALDSLLQDSPLSYLFYHPYAVVLFPKDGTSSTPQSTGSEKKEIVRILEGKPSAPGDKSALTLQGYVKDAQSGESIVGATVYIQDLELGTSTNDFGYYSITLPSGNYRLQVAYVGYESEYIDIDLQSSGSLNVDLYDAVLSLREITVTDQAEESNINAVLSGKTRLNISTLEKIHPFAGEIDVIKSLTLLPGVQTIGENASGFHVRGGTADQNLILMDEAMVFNPTHLFGFFSSYNPDVVKDATLYKGSIPPTYGGRLSSVVDVKLKEGNTKEFVGSGGIGLISSRLTLEGPLIKEKTTLIVAGRVSYNDLILKLINNIRLRRSSAFFYDANAKLVHRFNTNSKLTLSAYSSLDDFRLASDTTYQWKNLNAVIQWNRIFKRKFFSNFTYIHGRYDNQIASFEGPASFQFSSNIRYHQGKIDFSYYRWVRHSVDFGVQSIHYQVSPGERIPNTQDSQISPLNLARETALESAVYANDEIRLTEGLSLSLGLRYSFFYRFGPDSVFTYAQNVPRRIETTQDTTLFASGEVVQKYGGLEPRLGLRYQFNEQSSVKLAYTLTRQYIHQISNTAVATPVDVWKLSNRFLRPQIGEQISLGYFRNFRDNQIETSIEGYYKSLRNLLDYKEGSELLLNPRLEADLLAGRGETYGLEVLVRKNTGRVRGWLSYVYARSLRRINGAFPEERINAGNTYPANYDKPHDITCVVNYNIIKRVSLNANFTYSTGRPLTAPVSQFRLGRQIIPNFSERNQFRIPDYHRLDLSFRIENTPRKATRWKSSLVFAIYNVYGRDNAFSVFFQPNRINLPQAYQLSVVSRAIFTVTYDFEF